MHDDAKAQIMIAIMYVSKIDLVNEVNEMQSYSSLHSSDIKRKFKAKHIQKQTLCIRWEDLLRSLYTFRDPILCWHLMFPLHLADLCSNAQNET